MRILCKTTFVFKNQATIVVFGVKGLIKDEYFYPKIFLLPFSYYFKNIIAILQAPKSATYVYVCKCVQYLHASLFRIVTQ